MLTNLTGTSVKCRILYLILLLSRLISSILADYLSSLHFYQFVGDFSIMFFTVSYGASEILQQVGVKKRCE